MLPGSSHRHKKNDRRNISAMEFLPVLDPTDKPREGIWYSLIPRGGGPGVGVGHTCSYIPSGDKSRGEIVIVGGANPSGSFTQTYVINLEWDGLEARYEHCSFVPESCPQSLWVFGGAQQSGNLNCIQTLPFKDGGSRWRNVLVGGKPPCPRTYHTNSACIGDNLYVFSGGEAGASPVSDPVLHVFDTVSCSWSQPETQGKQPPARHGHIIIALGSEIYIHGGMAGDKFYSDMYTLDTGKMKWEKVQTKGDTPPGVAAHSAVALGKNIYVFGGMTSDGASNSMHRFHTEKRQWSLMTFQGDMPPNRLDHSMCLLPWKVFTEDEVGQARDSAVVAETLHLAFIFGGMDTDGVLHSDCVATMIT
ncbi:rab9 effector protein with kelch motifs isoform X2 [Lampris incognitus]|uniref:rab9 effector protein with kelch motifs isoform X2 n=1 Tax=Lampris incognitus TaxID=2546036 RepID=UPI0024B6350F|nr:rab9 effector protein with kelch motifs isoform X2 [Lampris incognitus]